MGGALLAQKNWDEIKDTNATNTANNLEAVLREMVEASFPEKTRSIKSTDAPWFNQEIRRAIARKMRIYKAEGKTPHYHEARRRCERLVKDAKKKFLGSIIDTTTLIFYTRR